MDSPPSKQSSTSPLADPACPLVHSCQCSRTAVPAARAMLIESSSKEAEKKGMEKRCKIILFVFITLLVIGGIVGLLLGLLLHRRYVYMEVHPRSENYYSSWDEPVIEFLTQDPGSFSPWVERINRFLREYETTVPDDPPRGPCSTAPRPNQFGMRSDMCEMAMRMWGPCTIDMQYGYPMGKPCVFLRLSHINNWVPEPYNISFPTPLPFDMPENLKQNMQLYPAMQYGDFIWVSCDGEFGADQENIGPVQYFPAPAGFPTKQLHTADKGPRVNRNGPDITPEPVVAVLFENPRRGVLINVECRIWSRDIVYDRTSRVGRARFELLVQ